MFGRPANNGCQKLHQNFENIPSSNKPLELKQNAESAFFEQEIMKRAAEAQPAESKTEHLRMDHDIEPIVIDQRPGMDVYKAIYEPQSESEADDNDNNDPPTESENKEIEVSNEQHAISSARTTDIVPAVQTNGERKDDDNIDEEPRRKKRKRKEREERKRRGRPTRSPTLSSTESNLDESSTDDEERRKRRKRRRKYKEEKKKRKKRKSSRRYED
jgi:hypothetical protein